MSKFEVHCEVCGLRNKYLFQKDAEEVAKVHKKGFHLFGLSQKKEMKE